MLPVFAVIGLGYFLRKKGIVDDKIETFLNRFAYYFILPCMIFSSIYGLPFEKLFKPQIILSLYIAAGIGLVLAIAAAQLFEKNKRAAIVTTAYRSNTAYIGIPLILNAYGKEGVAKLSVLIGFTAPVLIILSIIYLNAMYKNSEKKENFLALIVKDPLVISCVVTLIFAYYNIPLPKFATNTIELLGNMGAPLMLLAVGAGLRLTQIKKEAAAIVVVSAIKLFIVPVISFLVLKYLFPVTDKQYFHVAVLTFAMPSALSTYVLVKQYVKNDELCSAAITVSTVISIFTISIWLYILNSTGLGL